MKIQLGRAHVLTLSPPVWIHRCDPGQLVLALPSTVTAVTLPSTPVGYSLRTYRSADHSLLHSLWQRAGFAASAGRLDDALALCLPDGCFVITEQETGAIVASMMARHLCRPRRPFGGRIDWLATDPVHRMRGLGSICARSAVRLLLTLRYRDIWVTTDEVRIWAVRTFLGIGFVPSEETAASPEWKRTLRSLAGGDAGVSP